MMNVILNVYNYEFVVHCLEFGAINLVNKEPCAKCIQDNRCASTVLVKCFEDYRLFE